MLALDLETTSPDPEEARIVQAALVFVGGGMGTHAATMLCDPGIPIPAEATAVHGITTERAQAEGETPAVVARVLAEAITDAADAGMPLVVFNARYDLTVADRECARHGIGPFVVGSVVDPFVIDKQLDRYRRGSRKLDAMCDHYGAILGGAHDASHDALAAARLAWCIGARGKVVRRVRNAEEGREKAALVREWEAVRGDLGALFDAQRRWALAERDRFAEYKRSVGEHDEAARIEAEIGWPVLARRVAA